jgi:hydrogenase expression/formation protein HypC
VKSPAKESAKEVKVCLGIPGKIVECFDADGLRMAKVQFGGVLKEACLHYVPDAAVGDYVVVHVGFAISKLNEEEAGRTYRLLEEMGQLVELEAASFDASAEERKKA